MSAAENAAQHAAGRATPHSTPAAATGGSNKIGQLSAVKIDDLREEHDYFIFDIRE